VSASPQPRRIGVLGGTFDPVHYGHLHIARSLREALGLDRVIWVPAGRPPHKSGLIVSSDRDRLAMLHMALAGSTADEISTIERSTSIAPDPPTPRTPWSFSARRSTRTTSCS
jgi:nicotinate-nucleotide adenylyltransferase